jgi:hypothetical protein
MHLLAALPVQCHSESCVLRRAAANSVAYFGCTARKLIIRAWLCVYFMAQQQ